MSSRIHIERVPITCIFEAREILSTSNIESPCVRNCCLDEKDICLGCFRSIDEIVAWGSAEDTERRAILERAGQRKEEKLAKKRT